MDVPDIDSPLWKDIITGRLRISFSFLALNIFVTRAKMDIKLNPENCARYVNDLRGMFIKYRQLPAVEADLQKLRSLL